MSKTKDIIKPLTVIELKKIVDHPIHTSDFIVNLFIKCKIAITLNDYNKIQSYYKDKQQQLIFTGDSSILDFVVIDLKTKQIGTKTFDISGLIPLQSLFLRLIKRDNLEIINVINSHMTEGIDLNQRLTLKFKRLFKIKPLVGRGLTTSVVIMDDFGYFDESEEDGRNC